MLSFSLSFSTHLYILNTLQIIIAFSSLTNCVVFHSWINKSASPTSAKSTASRLGRGLSEFIFGRLGSCTGLRNKSAKCCPTICNCFKYFNMLLKQKFQVQQILSYLASHFAEKFPLGSFHLLIDFVPTSSGQ